MPLPPPTHIFATLVRLLPFFLLCSASFDTCEKKRLYNTQGGMNFYTFTHKTCEKKKSPSEPEFQSRRHLSKLNVSACPYKWECCGNMAFVWLLLHIAGFHTNPLSSRLACSPRIFSCITKQNSPG